MNFEAEADTVIVKWQSTDGNAHSVNGSIKKYIAAAIADCVLEEREACAKLAENLTATFEMTQSPLGIQGHVAKAIRERSAP